MGSGHYTAYGIHEGRWYHFNDSTVTLTNEDAVRKAKAYILFYVEKAEQVASDSPAMNRTATKMPAAADTAAGDGTPSVVITQDEVAAAGAATDVILLDVVSSQVNTQEVVATDNAALGNKGEDMAAVRDTDAVSVLAATDRDTSDEAGTDEAGRAVQAVAQ